MSNYDTFANLIQDGEVNLISIEAVPRSISTALCRALGESANPSICINEPFNRTRYDIEDASTRILDALNDSEAVGTRPITVVTKNMARNISRPLLSEIVELSSGIVWSVRDPRVQVSSLITRIANNLFCAPGADVLSQDRLTDEHVQVASDFLERGPRAKGFAKTNWSYIGEHHEAVGDAITSVVVDGTELTTRPREVLQELSRSLGITFSERMVSGWQGQFVNTNTGYSPHLSHEEDAWTRDAVTSNGIHASSTKYIDLERMPRSLQDHMKEVALPTYEHMTT